MCARKRSGAAFRLPHLILLVSLCTAAGEGQARRAASTGILRPGASLAVFDANGDGSVNYSNLGIDMVFSYPLAADQTGAGDVPVVGD